jgi:hypothetical protein
MSNLENTFEELFEYYRTDPSVRQMFKDLNISVIVKFKDTKRKFLVIIDQDRSIALKPDIDSIIPDIKVRVKSEQLLIDLVDGKLPVQEQFTKGRIMITKGLLKIIKIYRKYVGEPKSIPSDD